MKVRFELWIEDAGWARIESRDIILVRTDDAKPVPRSVLEMYRWRFRNKRLLVHKDGDRVEAIQL